MARGRSPSRLTSEMSSTTTTSAASISFAARSERSAPAGSRKANRSGTGVGFAIAGSRPRAPSKCHSATSLPTPSPSAFTCVVRATRRPEVSTAATVWAALARSGGTGTPFSITTRYDEPTRNTKASRETVATSSLDAFLQYGVFATVPEIDREPDHEPDGQPDPGVAGQGQHQAEAAHDAQDRDGRNPWRAEGAVQIGTLGPEDPHPGAHQHEREQRADVDPRPQQLQRQQPGGEADGDAGVDRREVGRAETGMDLAGPPAEQAIARHRVENARLSQEHHQDDGPNAQDRADVDRDANPPRRADPLHRVRHRRGEVELAVGDMPTTTADTTTYSNVQTAREPRMPMRMSR